jgi:hypothetical protein
MSLPLAINSSVRRYWLRRLQRKLSRLLCAMSRHQMARQATEIPECVTGLRIFGIDSNKSNWGPSAVKSEELIKLGGTIPTIQSKICSV